MCIRDRPIPKSARRGGSPNTRPVVRMTGSYTAFGGPALPTKADGVTRRACHPVRVGGARAGPVRIQVSLLTQRVPQSAASSFEGLGISIRAVRTIAMSESDSLGLGIVPSLLPINSRDALSRLRRDVSSSNVGCFFRSRCEVSTKARVSTRFAVFAAAAVCVTCLATALGP